MSKLPLYIDLERQEQSKNGYKSFETNCENRFYGRFAEEGIPLQEIHELENVAYDMSNFAYTCAVNNVPQWHLRNRPETKANDDAQLAEMTTEIGWRIARSHITRFRPGVANIYDKVDKHLFISANDIIRINDDFNIDAVKCEFNDDKILLSMARMLVLKNLELVERPEQLNRI